MKHIDPSAMVLVTWLACAICLGCNEDWQAATYPAAGRITINGEPPVGAVVQLHPAGEQPDVRNSRPWGLVQEDGTFTLSTYQNGDGAPAGDYMLTVTWPWDASRPSLDDRLGNAYSRPEKSRWPVTVSEGNNEIPPVEITKAKVARKRRPGLETSVMPGI